MAQSKVGVRRHKDSAASAILRKGTQVFSVFHAAEAAAADSLIRRYGLRRIEFADIPEGVQYNDADVPARFAIVCPKERLAEFDLLCQVRS